MANQTRRERDLELARIAKSHGARYALRIVLEARRSGIPISLGFALIEQESGFRNVFGHDPGNHSGAGVVTKAKYKAYKAKRGPTGRGGMQGVGPAQLCVSPEVRVLTADLQWLPAESVTEGQRIVAFDEEGAYSPAHPKTMRRHFQTAEVEAMKIDTMDRLRVVTGQREIIVTPNHPFLTWRPERFTWREAQLLQAGDLLPAVPVWESDRSYEGGYLAGQLDGEGCLTVGKVREGRAFSRLLWAQTADSPDVPFMRGALERRDFQVGYHKVPPRGWGGEHTARGKPMTNLTVGGTWLEQARAIGSLRPRRMLRHPRLAEMWEQRQLNSCSKEPVLAVEPMAPGPMVAHQTSTRTLLTEGLLSHNTWFAYQDQADSLGGCWIAKHNIRVGFQVLAHLMKQHGEATGIARYNGSGAAADRYSREVRAKQDKWHRRLTA